MSKKKFDMQNSNNSKNIEKEETLKPLIWLFLIIFIFWIGSFLIQLRSFSTWADRGTFGDSFGAINSLFSGLAFAGIIYTIFLQRKELKLQRLELAETRKELKRTAEAQEKSEISLAKQAYNLKISSQLTALNSLVSVYSEQEQIYSTRDAKKRGDAKIKKDKYINQIEFILNKLDNE